MIKFLVKVGPLIAFFIGFIKGGILNATLYLLIASLIALILSYLKEKTINKVTLVSSALLLISASLTLFTGNPIFIKMKPTLCYLIFTVILFITHFQEKTAIEFVFGKTISFKNSTHWKRLNFRFAIFFILMAVSNEIIWRNFADDIWVNFKFFGVLPITLIFIISQIPFIMRHQKSTF